MKPEELSEGQKVYWKKSGQWGSYDATIIAIGAKLVTIEITGFMGIVKEPFRRNVYPRNLHNLIKRHEQ
jgi:hypothetical protein